MARTLNRWIIMMVLASLTQSAFALRDPTRPSHLPTTPFKAPVLEQVAEPHCLQIEFHENPYQVVHLQSVADSPLSHELAVPCWSY